MPTRISGCASAKRGRRGNSQPTDHECRVAMRTRRASRSVRTLRTTSSRSARLLPAASARRRPAGVSSTPRAWRWNRETPSQVSSLRTWWLTAPAVRLSSSAAWAKFWWRAAASNAARAGSHPERIIGEPQAGLMAGARSMRLCALRDDREWMADRSFANPDAPMNTIASATPASVASGSYPTATLELVLLGAIWGASFLFLRVAAPVFGPLALVEVRLALGALILMPFLWRARARFPLRLWPKLVVIGAINS